jgi:hypothetical protein
MIRDLLNLDTETHIFYSQTMKDLEFINSVMETLAEKFLVNSKLLDREVEADNILDTEWRFNQVINEISNNSRIFPQSIFPEMITVFSEFRKNSIKRQKQIEESYIPSDHSIVENVVSNAELNGLLSN